MRVFIDVTVGVNVSVRQLFPRERLQLSILSVAVVGVCCCGLLCRVFGHRELALPCEFM